MEGNSFAGLPPFIRPLPPEPLSFYSSVTTACAKHWVMLEALHVLINADPSLQWSALGKSEMQVQLVTTWEFFQEIA